MFFQIVLSFVINIEYLYDINVLIYIHIMQIFLLCLKKVAAPMILDKKFIK